MKILQHLKYQCFFSLEKLIFYQEHCQTLFLINLAEKSEGKETSNF